MSASLYPFGFEPIGNINDAQSIGRVSISYGADEVPKCKEVRIFILRSL